MVEPRFQGIVHCHDEGSLWASRREVIYKSTDGGRSWQQMVKLPISGQAVLKSRTGLSRRLFRMMVYQVQVVQERYLSVLGFGRFFCFDLQQNCALLATGDLQGKRPLVYCKSSAGNLLYGEYRGNPGRTPVGIWESRDGGQSWRVAHTFKDVRHIHGVFQDPYENLLWITTGDKDHESAIWKASPDFSSLDKVVSGSQQARAITLEFTADKVFYGTDTPLEANYLYSFSRRNPEPERLAMVDGSVFHSCRVGREMFFSTACEPSDVNKAGCASVYRVNEAGECTRMVSWRKDVWGMRLFQYGQVFFATGQTDGPGLWVTPFATQEDQQSRYFNLTKES